MKTTAYLSLDSCSNAHKPFLKVGYSGGQSFSQ